MVSGSYSSYSAALGDVGGDLNLVVGNGMDQSQQSRIYLNLQRQLHAPTAPQIGQPFSLDANMRYGTSAMTDFAAVDFRGTAPGSAGGSSACDRTPSARLDEKTSGRISDFSDEQRRAREVHAFGNARSLASSV